MTTTAKKAAAYGEFIKNLQIGDIVSIYSFETRETHSTRIVGITTKHVITQRTGSTDAPIRFTRRGTGTAATGTEGLKLRPYAQPRLRKFNPKSVYRPARTGPATVEQVEEAVA